MTHHELEKLSDGELLDLVDALRDEARRRNDAGPAASSEEAAADRIKLGAFARAMRSVWSGYTAVTKEDGAVHLVKADESGGMIDVWLRLPSGYPDEKARAIRIAIAAALEAEVKKSSAPSS